MFKLKKQKICAFSKKLWNFKAQFFIILLFSMVLNKAGLHHISKFLNRNSKVLMRVDFNVPITNGIASDITRIQSTIPTINDIIKNNPKSLVLLSHLGRPDGNINLKYSLKPIVPYLESLLKKKVRFLDNCIGSQVQEAVNNSEGQIFLCQNVRFHLEEEGVIHQKSGKITKASEQSIKLFRKQLSSLGNIFVNDAFGTAHRDHSSVVGIDHKIRVAGHLMKKQLDFFGTILKGAQKPVVVIIGGAKVHDKIQLIQNMINIADEIIIGGGMAYTFLKKIHNISIGKSIFDKEGYEHLDRIFEKAKAKGVKIHLPIDFVSGKHFKNETQKKTFTIQSHIHQDFIGMDGGPQTIRLIKSVIARAKTIVWNGPMGVFQFSNFKISSVALLNDIIQQTQKGARSIVGGGDSVSLVHSEGVQGQLTHVSTGGGATLQLLQGIQLPGVKHLTDINQL